MSLKTNKLNVILRSLQPRNGPRPNGPTPPPRSALIGGTGLSRNVYGAGRGSEVTGSYAMSELRQWRAGRGTTQDRYAKTRLPGEGR